MDIVFISVSVSILALLCLFLNKKIQEHDSKLDHIESFLYDYTRKEGDENNDDN